MLFAADQDKGAIDKSKETEEDEEKTDSETAIVKHEKMDELEDDEELADGRFKEVMGKILKTWKRLRTKKRLKIDLEKSMETELNKLEETIDSQIDKKIKALATD